MNPNNDFEIKSDREIGKLINQQKVQQTSIFKNLFEIRF